MRLVDLTLNHQAPRGMTANKRSSLHRKLLPISRVISLPWLLLRAEENWI